MDNTGPAMSQKPVIWPNNYAFQTKNCECFTYLWYTYKYTYIYKYVPSLIRILWITYFPGTTELQFV